MNKYLKLFGIILLVLAIFFSGFITACFLLDNTFTYYKDVTLAICEDDNDFRNLVNDATKVLSTYNAEFESYPAFSMLNCSEVITIK